MNCRWNEEKVFPSLKAELDRDFIEARLHTDGDRGEELSAYQQEIARSLATPHYLVIDPESGRPIAPGLGGIVTVEGFRQFLEGARAAAQAGEKVGRLDPR